MLKAQHVVVRYALRRDHCPACGMRPIWICLACEGEATPQRRSELRSSVGWLVAGCQEGHLWSMTSDAGKTERSQWGQGVRGSPVSILCDHQIKQQIGITPFEANQARAEMVSYGVSSYGYDVRVGTRFKIFTNTTSGGTAVVDPKCFTDDLFVTVDTNDTGRDHVLIPPNSFALAETVEWIEVPRNVLAICVGKSTYARCGLIVNVTPLEPEWRGKVTLEISNTTPLPAKVYANEGIAQMLFLEAQEECAISYADKKGKYQDQEGLTLPRVDA